MQKQAVFHYPGEPTDPRAKAAWFEQMTQWIEKGQQEYDTVKESPIGDAAGVLTAIPAGFLSGLSPKFLKVWNNLSKRPDYQQWYKNRSLGNLASTNQTNWLKRTCDN